MRNQKQSVKNKQTSTGHIRLIAGKHRGRKLPVILADGLRPTTDRIKETVFNWLMPYVGESNCLDCFSGAGSLGFEAYSRGASTVTLLELNKAASEQLKSNKRLLNADNITIVNTDALQYLQQPKQTFDLVFIDPPFRRQLVIKTIALLSQGWLADGAIIYVEVEKELATLDIPSTWQLLKEKTSGQVSYRLYKA